MSIQAYSRFLPPELCARLWEEAEPTTVSGMRVGAGLQAAFPRMESARIQGLIVEVYRAVESRLAAVLRQRELDRAFIDARTLAGLSVIGGRDEAGRIVVGPSGLGTPAPQVVVPAFLRGPQVTLFGPPDSPRMAINAMNAIHRRRADEPEIIGRLLADSGAVPRWGADSEDSKTPRAEDLLGASENLAGCFDGSLELTDSRTGRQYKLAETGRSLPIKRVAGLALPDGYHLLDRAPLPLHLVELVAHVWLHRARPEALVFYFPKIENEEEAAYLAALLAETEAAVGRADPSYVPGAIRLLIVFENPRAIFRIREIAAALGPYFLGGSLGWHDFLASTARLFRHDPSYRIPVKADPNIVIRHIRESHHILVRELGTGGALKIGGMYGVLPLDGDPASQRVSMVGFIRDVVTQLKRGLDGYWVAHPDFVRPGLALVEAWNQRESGALVALIRVLVPEESELEPLLAFVAGPDVPGLSQSDPDYLRAVLAAELSASPLIANDDPAEVRYNVFQALQYLADWLRGNGCVALPATLKDASGQEVLVRIMDDLATTERSRWELWAEVHHKRVSQALFEQILAEELAFIKADTDTEHKRIAVRWQGEAGRWYPTAAEILRELVIKEEPPEFVTELLLPYLFGQTPPA